MNSITVPESLAAYEAQIKDTLTPYIAIATQETSTTLPIEASKIGGFAYWPENKPFFSLDNSTPKLLAQINFSELKAQDLLLPDFPEEGLLQFFYPQGDDMSGLRFENEIDFSITRVVYHPNTDALPSQRPELFISMADNTGMPCDKELALQFSLAQEYLGLSDEYLSDKRYHFEGELDDAQMDEFYESFSNSGSKLGGYAYFTQSDPRPFLNIDGISEKDKSLPEEEWVLLLQIDSDDHLMWGDSGVANWFIRRKDLQARDFSQVLFNWDCC